MRDANGEPQGVIRVIQDVTELAAVERELRHQQWLLSQAQRLAQVGTLYRDMASGAITLSDQVSAILGVAPGTSFQGLASYVHPDDAQAFADSTQVLRDQPRQITHEFRILRPDGMTRHLNSVADATMDAEGRVTGVLRVIQDVTPQKQANAALREKEWLLSRAQTVGRFGTWFRNLDTHTLSWSDETYRIFGMEPGAQIHFESYSEAILLEDRERFLTERGRVTRTGGSFTLEFRIRRGDGEIRTLWMVAERVFASVGRSNGILGIVQDITERKAAETEVREREWVLSRAQ
ncbi:MAG TPA: PAS domain-containing protein, partial [bacterium]